MKVDVTVPNSPYVLSEHKGTLSLKHAPVVEMIVSLMAPARRYH